MKSKYWLIGWLSIVSIALGSIGIWVYKIDPYMHFHKPNTDNYFYTLDNQRSQNDGITKHFDYDALITGTSMTENFRSSEMDNIFNCNSIKVCYSGGSFKEINDNLKVAAKNNPDLNIVVRGLDMSYFFMDKDYIRNDLGVYPSYLYDSNPFNDVEYIWNRDIIWNRAYKMAAANNNKNFKPGITSFDDYSRWKYECTYGINTLCPNGISDFSKGKAVHLTSEEKEKIRGNITQNVTNLAVENPNITFYYFFPPYSIVWWKDQVKTGNIYKQIEAEQYIIELILEHENIKLFSFNNRLDITTDLNNYKDQLHYGPWVNSLILQWMHSGEYQITKENYLAYLETELSNYLDFDYKSLNAQIDYENDSYAAALSNKELTGTAPLKILDMPSEELHLSNSAIIANQYNNSLGISCTGNLNRDLQSNTSVYDYIMNSEYIGAKVEIDEVADYQYLVFYGKKISDHGQPTVYVIDSTGKKIGEISEKYQDIDNEWQQYVIDISNANGPIKIIFNGGYTDNTGSIDSEYIFSDITLY